MSTRSRIGIEAEDGSIQSIYLHWDGHPDTAGATLAENYPTREAAEALVGLGDLSSLAESLDGCDAYCRDQGEEWADNRPESHASAEEYRDRNAGNLVAYVYLHREDGWSFAGWDGEWRRLRGASDEHPASQDRGEGSR